MGGSALVVACVVLLAAQPAIGADPDELARRIKSGSQVFVIDWTGAERAGTVVGISGSGDDDRSERRLTLYGADRVHRARSADRQALEWLPDRRGDCSDAVRDRQHR